jgi:ankyrin repeat protein
MDRTYTYGPSSNPLPQPERTGPLQAERVEPAKLLFGAIHAKDVEKLKGLLAKGISINSTPENAPGLTALYLAVRKKDEYFARLLLEHGADPTLERPDGSSARSEAAKESPKISQMIEESAPTLPNLFQGVTHQDLGRIRRVLAAGFNVNSANKMGVTALQIAVKVGDEEIVDFLLMNGADPELRCQDGSSARSIAPAQPNKRIATIIEERVSGVQDVDRLMSDRKVAQAFDAHFLEACRRGNVAEVERLIASGEVNIAAYTDEFPAMRALQLAVQNGHRELIPILVKSGAEPNATDSLGRTPLTVAVDRRDLAAVRMLIEYGANINEGSFDPLYIAMKNDEFAISKLLVENGASRAGVLKLANEKGEIWTELIKEGK